jgi:hypothetical protein
VSFIKKKTQFKKKNYTRARAARARMPPPHDCLLAQGHGTSGCRSFQRVKPTPNNPFEIP